MNSFAQFIEEFTCGDAQLQNCLQELFGCILTNNLQYKTCILLHGLGNNGKTLLLQLLGLAIARYQFVRNGMFPIFTGSGNQGKSLLNPCHYVLHCNDLNNINYGSLVDKKLCIFEEFDDIRQYSGTIKSLIGGDSHPYEYAGEMCTMVNRAYLIFVSNRDYQGLDPVLSRRMIKIPCLNQPKVDYNLLEKLSDSNIIGEMIEWMEEGDLRVRQQEYITRL